MLLTVWIAAIALGVFALHRLALWMESRGWIFYLKTRASGGALGSAFLEIQQIAQPGTKYVLEMKRESRAERDDESGPK
jgi:hypothetical protein